jgi:SAM-dependent methyltransferase
MAPDNGRVFKRDPLYFEDGIPVFTELDFYVENYERIARDHIGKISEGHENPFIEEELWIALEVNTRAHIDRHVKPGSRILDIGVGLGRLLEPLTEYKRYGIDISLDYLKHARARGIDVAMAKIEDLPYQDGFFDAVVTCDVLEHVLDLNLCCRRIIASLRPGGTLIVRVPYKEDMNVYLRDDLPYEYIHLRNFDEASLRLMFGKIFGLNFKEANISIPYLQGAPRLKMRLLPEDARQKVLATLADFPDAADILPALAVSEESFVNWLYELQSSQPALFKALAPELVHGIEIDCVFEKPIGYNDGHSYDGRIESAVGVMQDQGAVGLALQQVDRFGRNLNSAFGEINKRLDRIDSANMMISSEIEALKNSPFNRILRRLRPW